MLLGLLLSCFSDPEPTVALILHMEGSPSPEQVTETQAVLLERVHAIGLHGKVDLVEGDLQVGIACDRCDLGTVKTVLLRPGKIEIGEEGFEHPTLTNEHLASAEITDDLEGMPAVTLVFTDKGAKAFAELTTRIVDEKLAIVVDGTVVSAPVVMEPIVGGKAQIMGTESDVRSLAWVLDSGALPVTLTLSEERSLP